MNVTRKVHITSVMRLLLFVLTPRCLQERREDYELSCAASVDSAHTRRPYRPLVAGL